MKKHLLIIVLIASFGSAFAQAVPATKPVVKGIIWLGQATPPASPGLYEQYKDSDDGITYEWDGDSWEPSGSAAADGNDFPTGLNLTGTLLTLTVPNQSNPSVDLAPLQDGIGTDDQELSITGNILNIEGGTVGIDLSTYLDNTDNQDANEVAYDPTASGLIATNTQAAIDELAATGGGGAAGSDYSYNTVSSSITASNAEVVNTGRKVWNKVTTNDTIIFDNTITLIGNPSVWQPWTGADSLYIKRGSGIDFYISDSTSVLAADGLIVRQRHPITVLKTAASEYFLQGVFESHSEQTDPYLALNPVAYFNANNIAQADGSDVTQWDDLTGNGYHWIQGVDAPVFDNTPGFNQVVFDGVDDMLLMAADHAALDFVPDVDDYTIIFHMGNVTHDNFSSYTWYKGTATASADRQFSMSSNTSGTNMTNNIGGGTDNLIGYRTDIVDDYIVIRRSGGNYTIYANDTVLFTDVPGTISTNGNGADAIWTIAGRYTNSLYQSCSFRKIVFYDYAVDLGVLSTRYNNRETE